MRIVEVSNPYECWHGYFHGWSCTAGHATAIVETFNGRVREVPFIEIRFMGEP